jgi:hypothetical protein
MQDTFLERFGKLERGSPLKMDMVAPEVAAQYQQNIAHGMAEAAMAPNISRVAGNSMKTAGISEEATTVTAPTHMHYQQQLGHYRQQASVMEQISIHNKGRQRDSSGSPYTDVVSTKPHTAPNITSVTNPEVSRLYEQVKKLSKQVGQLQRMIPREGSPQVAASYPVVRPKLASPPKFTVNKAVRRRIHRNAEKYARLEDNIDRMSTVNVVPKKLHSYSKFQHPAPSPVMKSRRRKKGLPPLGVQSGIYRSIDAVPMKARGLSQMPPAIQRSQMSLAAPQFPVMTPIRPPKRKTK